jgi:hypothetical protein
MPSSVRDPTKEIRMKTRNTVWTRSLRACALAVPLTMAATATSAQTQSWDYKSYIKDKTSGQYSKEKFLTSTIKLEEKDGKATFRMVTAGRGDPCISRSDLPAEVERSTEVTTIVVTPELAGCEPFRYVIKNDGSGGVRYFRKDDRWVPDGFDHGLTPTR